MCQKLKKLNCMLQDFLYKAFFSQFEAIMPSDYGQTYERT